MSSDLKTNNVYIKINEKEKPKITLDNIRQHIKILTL